MEELNWNLIVAAFLNFFAVAVAFTRQKTEEKKAENKKGSETPVPRPEPATSQMMLSKWSHVG